MLDLYGTLEVGFDSPTGIHMNTRTHVILPSNVISEIDQLVGKRGRSQFLAQAAAKELVRMKQMSALEQAFGAWKAEDHPELEKGVAAHVREMRQESEVRFKKQFAVA